MMARDFYFNCAYNWGRGYQGDGVGRDFEIKKFDNTAETENCGGWESLKWFITARRISRILRRGEVVDKAGATNIARYVSTNGSNGGTRICDIHGDGGDWALFEYRQGRWYFVELDSCETE